MAKFCYRGRTSGGQLIQGEREAIQAESLAETLMAEDIIPLNITKIDTKPSFLDQELFASSRKIKKTTILVFYQQMHHLVRAGIPLLVAVSRLLEIAEDSVLIEALQGIQMKLSKGESFSNAARQYPRAFSNVAISLLAAGETNGRMDQAFELAAKHLEFEVDTLKKIQQTLRYPLTVVLMASGAMIILNIFVIPVFAKLYGSFNHALPLPTRILIAISTFMHDHWFILLCLVTLLVASTRYFLNRSPLNYLWAQYQLKIPIIGEMIEHILMAGFARSLALLLNSGVPLTQALNLVSKISDNIYAEAKILKVREHVERGESLAQAARSAHFFSSLVLQMLAIGEETGSNDKMLEQVAEFYEEDVRTSVSRLAARMEPILLLILGAMVLVLALGVFLPMWDMTSFIK